MNDQADRPPQAPAPEPVDSYRISEAEWTAIISLPAVAIVFAILGLCLAGTLPWPVAIVAGLMLMAAMAWLLASKCRFTVSQGIAAVLLFGLAMGMSRLGSRNDVCGTVVFSIVNAFAVSLGLFLGARNVSALGEATQLESALAFAAGLLIVYAVLGGLASLCMLLEYPVQSLCGLLFCAACVIMTYRCHRRTEVAIRASDADRRSEQ